MTKETTIRLARHFEVFIEDQIAARKYGSATSVIEEALRLLERREAKQEELARLLQEGLDSGPASPLDFDEIKRMAREESGLSADA